MTSPFELSQDAVDEHARSLGAAASTVHTAGVAGRARVGAMDFGALFATTLVPLVNAALDQMDGAVQRHGTDLEQHRSDFVATTATLQQQDESGARTVETP